MSEEEKPKRIVKSKILIRWIANRQLYEYVVQDKDGDVVVSHGFETEDAARKDISRLRRILKNRFLKIDVE